MNDSIALPSNWHVLLDLYGFLLPFMLYAVWSTLAFWDLGRREDQGKVGAWLWIAAVLLLPFVGALGYLTLGKSTLSRNLRLSVVGAGVGTYALVLLLASQAG